MQVPRFLKVLNLSHCYDLKKIPENLKLLTELKKLNLHMCEKLKSLPSSLMRVVKLVEGELDSRLKPKGFPHNFIPSSLQLLSMYNNPRLLHDFGTTGLVFTYSIAILSSVRGQISPIQYPRFILNKLDFTIDLIKRLDCFPCIPNWHHRYRWDDINFFESWEVRCRYPSKLVNLVKDFEDLQHLEELDLTDCGALQTLRDIRNGQMQFFRHCDAGFSGHG